jgi:hypothetical protein
LALFPEFSPPGSLKPAYLEKLAVDMFEVSDQTRFVKLLWDWQSATVYCIGIIGLVVSQLVPFPLPVSESIGGSFMTDGHQYTVFSCSV